MADRPLTFEGLLGRAPSVPSNLDKHGRPYVRRTLDGHVIVITDPLQPLPPLSWIVVYAHCPPGCGGSNGVGSHSVGLKPGDRLGDEHVGAWPFLNQWGYHEDWVLEQIDGLRKAIKAQCRTYGEQSAKIGALRAELARARERIRELGSARESIRGQATRTRREVLDAFGIPASLRAEWAGIDRGNLRRFLPERAECRRYDSGTWVHASTGHTCPRWARG